MTKLSHTQCMALTWLHKQMKDFLCNYAENKLQDKFFLEGMLGMIEQIDTFVRENGSYNCSDSRVMKISKRFLQQNPWVNSSKYRCGFCRVEGFPSTFLGEVTRDGQLCRLALCTYCANILREEGATLSDGYILKMTEELEKRLGQRRKDAGAGLAEAPRNSMIE